MSTPDTTPFRPSLPIETTRRSLILAVAGASAGAIVSLSRANAAPSRSGATRGRAIADHGDDSHDEQGDDKGNGKGKGNDDNPVVVSEKIPEGSTEVRIVSDDPDGSSPSTVSIDAGNSVTFVNTRHDAHTATGGSFDTGILQPGALATITFTEGGTFPYTCQIHPDMTGSVVVRGKAGTSTPTTATPAAPGSTPASTPVSTTGTAATAASVTIRNFAFVPVEMRIAAGTTVTWSNEDRAAHTATAIDGSFDTKTIEPTRSGSIRFTTPGRVDYQCAIHPNMVGVLIVG